MHSHFGPTSNLKHLVDSLCDTLNQFNSCTLSLYDSLGIRSLVAGSNPIMAGRYSEEEKIWQDYKNKLQSILPKLKKLIQIDNLKFEKEITKIQKALTQCNKQTLTHLNDLTTWVKFEIKPQPSHCCLIS